MSRRPIEEQAEADAARLSAEGLRDDERARLWGRIEHSAARARGRRRMRVGLALAVPAFAAAAAYLVMTARERAVVQRDPCALDAAAEVLRVRPGCGSGQPVRIGRDVWTLQPDAVVERVSGGASVAKGRVRFQVHKRESAHEGFRVRVSHGEVQVVGTVFEVVQRADGGSVTVSEGVIEFVWRDGKRERVAAGQRLVWPRAETGTGAGTGTGTGTGTGAGTGTGTGTGTGIGTGTGTGTEAVRSARSQDLEPVLERLLQLQSQRRFGEAVVLLRRTLEGGGLSGLQRERISYELGLALDASAQPSCAHWKAHVKRFGMQRHAETLGERLKGCEK